MTELAAPPPRVSAAGLAPDAAGVTPPANPDRHGAFLADVVVELGFADRETIEKVEAESRRSMQSFEQVLLASGALDEEQLSLAIAERNGLDHVDLDRFDVDMEAAEMIGRAAARRYRAAPIAFAADGALIVAVEDPYNSLAVSDIEAITRSEVRPVIATGRGIQSLIEQLPEEPARHAPPPEPVGEPEPEPVAMAAEPPEPPVAMAQPDRERRDRLADLEALREAVRRADALAGAVGERIAELEGADDRARRLERELAAAQERIATLEQRLSRFASAAGDAVAAIEKLGALQRVLEETGP